MESQPSSGSAAPPRFSLEGRICLLLVLLVLAVFNPVLRGDLLDWDDDINITKNFHLNTFDFGFLHWALTDTAYMWRYQPLSWVTWAAVRHVAGLSPFAHHLIVLLFHAANTCLVFFLLRKLLFLTRSDTASPSPHLLTAAGLGAALWAVHPMRAETTGWAVELIFAQALFFLLLTLLAYLHAHSGNNTRPRWVWLAALFFLLSLLSYPLALPLVAVLIVIDFCPLGRLPASPRQWFTPASRTVWFEKLPFIALTLIFAAANLYVRSHNTGSWPKPVSLAVFGWLLRIMQAFYMWAYYVWKPWLPWNLTPVPDQLLDFHPFDAPFVASAGLVAGLTVFLFWNRRRWPAGLAVWLCHLAMLVPMLGLTEHPQFPADRYSLVVGIGWSILLAGWFLQRVENGVPVKQLSAGALAIILILSVASNRQSRIWQNNVTLFTRAVDLLAPDSPHRPKLLVRLGEGYQKRGDPRAAAEAYEQAIHMAPDAMEPHRHRGSALFDAGDWDGAIAEYRETLRLDPSQTAVLNDLGVSYGRSGQLGLARQQFQEVLRRNPDQISANQNMAIALRLQGKTNEAAGFEKRARELTSPVSPH